MYGWLIQYFNHTFSHGDVFFHYLECFYSLSSFICTSQSLKRPQSILVIVETSCFLLISAAVVEFRFLEFSLQLLLLSEEHHVKLQSHHVVYNGRLIKSASLCACSSAQLPDCLYSLEIDASGGAQMSLSLLPCSCISCSLKLLG